MSQYDGSDTSYHQYDGQGSTDALLDDWEAATDRAFGLEKAHSGTSDNRHSFVGRQSYYKDPELELYLLGARYYDPQAGRFLSEDPLGYQSDDLNLYAYVHNNPVNATDPSGMAEAHSWNALSDAQRVQAWSRLSPTAKYLLGTTHTFDERRLLVEAFGGRQLIEQLKEGRAELRREIGKRFPLEGSHEDHIAGWSELSLLDRRAVWLVLPESARQALLTQLNDNQRLRDELQAARRQIRNRPLFQPKKQPTRPQEPLELPPADTTIPAPPPRATQIPVPPRVATSPTTDAAQRTMKTEQVYAVYEEVASVLETLNSQLADIERRSEARRPVRMKPLAPYEEPFQERFDKLAKERNLTQLRSEFAQESSVAASRYLTAFREIEKQAREYADKELARQAAEARKAAQADMQEEERRRGEKLLVIAEATAKVADAVDKVPLADLFIAPVLDIFLKASQLLSIDLDIEGARAAQEQAVQAHLADDKELLREAQEAKQKAIGQASRATGSLLAIYATFLTAGVASVLSGKGGGGSAEQPQRPAEPQIGKPQEPGPLRRLIDKFKQRRDKGRKSDASLPLADLKLGQKLGSGGNKDVFAVVGDDSLAVGVLRSGPRSKIEAEVSLLQQLESKGLPTVNVRGIIEVNGRPAIVMDRFADESKRIVAVVNNKVMRIGNSRVLNQRSVADLREIRRVMIEQKVKVDDLQFLIGSDGRVVIADPLGVHANPPNAKNLRMIDLLIKAAQGE